MTFPGDWSKHVRRKAQKMADNTVIRIDEDEPTVWWVGTADPDAGKELYRVELLNPEAASCTCRYGLQLGGGDCRCSHVLAVRVAQRALIDSNRES